MTECFFNGQPLKEDFLPHLTNTALIGYTRDIYLGRGNYNTAYMMLATLIKFNRMDLFDYIFERFFYIEGQHPYGSYKDIKYFCGYIKESELPNKRDLYHHIIRKFIKPQLEKDIISDTPTLLAKWLPREKSKFGWLAKEIAWVCYDEGYDKNSHAMKQYRNDITEINRRLDTAQIHMKPDDWDIQELRGETLRLQYRTFMTHCPEQIKKREPYFNQALMTPQYLVNFSLAKKDPLYNYCWEELSKQYPKTKQSVAVDCVEGIGFAVAAATDYVYTGTKRIDVRRPFNEAVREIYHALAPVQVKEDFILFTNKEYKSGVNMHWNVTGEPAFPKGNIISGNNPLMLKCYLKGELTFEAMLKDSRYN
jgi:hypothetical protein